MKPIPRSGAARRHWLAATLLAAATALAGCATGRGTDSGPPAEVRAALAPTGTLRVAVYPGSPTSLVQQAPPAQMRGVAVDLGRLLADRLEVPAEIKVYPRLAEALGAVQRGEADFTITNATAERARQVDFGPTLLDVELGLLVLPGSPVLAVDRVDMPGVTVGVSQGSTSERVLAGRYQLAKLRSFPTLEAARNALLLREIDAFATNKAILFEMSDVAPGTRVLPGRWGTEHLAPAVPKGRDAGLRFLRRFVEQVQRNGQLQRATERAGLRGTVPASP